MGYFDKTIFQRLLLLAWSVAFLLCFHSSAIAQTTASESAPKVFFDCQTLCYWDHIRSELSYLDFMRDRQNADVYLLLTSLTTGSDGTQWTLTLNGLDRFEGMTDTLVFFTGADATDGQLQNLQVEKIQMALLPFILKTSLAGRVQVHITKDTAANGTSNTKPDPWDYWVFSLGGELHLNGEESFASLNAKSFLSVNRVTDYDKLGFSVDYNYSRNRFSLEEEDFISKIRQLSVWTIYVHSISDHWSLGGFASIYNSTVANIDFSTSLRPAIEYNVFPYAQATKRQFTFLYNIGPFFNNYADTTIFNVERQWFVRQDMEVDFRQIQEWGTLNIGIEFANYLHDWSLLALTFNPEIGWNIFRGFNLNMGGEISLVRNQLNIRKGSATNEEVLLQLRDIGTNYQYQFYMGISYRFGSLTSNVVNTRF
ncbi:MAG: hypothetical protein EPO28_00010 [Saprospiraceae bacterium]|nr:MAG: hypothetical protein EPO28_00010 [Saprospiraceae bacterium]